MPFCIPREIIEDFKKRLQSREITPDKLINMTSNSRRVLFSEVLGENIARQANALFESKLLLKNQQQGIINWAKKLTGLKPEVLRDILSRVEKMTEVLEAKDLENFLEDLAARKLGFDVTFEEAAKISELARTTADKKALVREDMPIRSPERLDYGIATVLFKDYIDSLKIKAKKFTFKDYLKKPQQALFDLGGVFKSILSSLDNSFFGRQGIKTLYTQPKIWSNAFLKSWKDIAESLKGGDPALVVKADVMSRPNMLNGKYKTGKYDLNILTEEAFPSHFPSKIPLIGRFFKAAESAYNNAALRIRSDYADKIIKLAEEQGINALDPLQAEGMGRLVNSMTGRGSLGKLTAVSHEVNVTFFSLRFLKSNFDTLTFHLLDPKATPFVKKVAATNLVKIVGSIATILAIADQLWPGSVEWNPTSSDFGKIKIGNTRFDVTGGMGSLVVLSARLATGKFKSATTGKITDLSEGKFGQLNRLDLFEGFIEGKLSPMFGLIRDVFKGRTFEGEKPTFIGSSANLLTPLSIQNFQELLKDQGSANILIAMILEGLGISTNTFSSRAKPKPVKF